MSSKNPGEGLPEKTNDDESKDHKVIPPDIETLLNEDPPNPDGKDAKGAMSYHRFKNLMNLKFALIRALHVPAAPDYKKPSRAQFVKAIDLIDDKLTYGPKDYRAFLRQFVEEQPGGANDM